MAPRQTAPKGAKPDTEAAETALGEDEPKVVKWRELTLELPAKLPGAVLFDVAEIEDERKQIAPTLNLIRSLVGDDQFQAVRDKIASDELDFDETMDEVGELLNECLSPYGLSAGKSEASPGSS